jgi:hypothetical protein
LSHPPPPHPYYVISYHYALQNRKNSALSYLHKAIQKGFNNREHLDNDPDFDTLRDDEEFQKIIKTMCPSNIELLHTPVFR